MKHGSLFSGIGGFDLAAEWMGWENVFHCEWNEFGRRILKYYWPNAINYGDITKTDFTIHRGQIDIITGGFPCQPYSLAGKRKGKEDERHLWPEMLRAIREIQPSWIVGENVPGIINWSGGLVFHEVQTDLEIKGYEVFPVVLPACSVNAPHRRDRVWFVAYNNKNGQHGCNFKNEVKSSKRRVKAQYDAEKIITYSNQNEYSIKAESRQWGKSQQFNRSIIQRQWAEFSESELIRINDGIPEKLDEARNAALGNAVVPQVVYQIFKAIEQYDIEYDKNHLLPQ